LGLRDLVRDVVLVRDAILLLEAVLLRDAVLLRVLVLVLEGVAVGGAYAQLIPLVTATPL